MCASLSSLYNVFSSASARVLLRPERVRLLVCRLSSTLAPSRDAVACPLRSLSDFLFLISLTTFRPSSTTSEPQLVRASTASAAVFPSAFPAEFVVVVVVVVSVETLPVSLRDFREPLLQHSPYIKRRLERSSRDGRRQIDRQLPTPLPSTRARERGAEGQRC